MKRLMILLCFSASVTTLAPQAQATDFIFSYFLCSPTSCAEEGPAEKSGSVLVSYNSTCTGGAIGGYDGDVEVVLANCAVPYIPYALVQTHRTQYLDDCGYPYYVDYVTPNGEVFNASGTVVFHIDITYGCDGSKTNQTTFGTKPC
jgi:predicted outer membrane repeat protein